MVHSAPNLNTVQRVWAFNFFRPVYIKRMVSPGIDSVMARLGGTFLLSMITGTLIGLIVGVCVAMYDGVPLLTSYGLGLVILFGIIGFLLGIYLLCVNIENNPWFYSMSYLADWMFFVHR